MPRDSWGHATQRYFHEGTSGAESLFDWPDAYAELPQATENGTSLLSFSARIFFFFEW